MPSDRLASGIAIVVVVVWVVSFVVSLFNHDFKPPPELTALITAVVTWALGLRLLRRGEDKD